MTHSPDIRDIERQVIDFMLAHGITPPRDGLIIDGQRHRYSIEGKDKGASKSGAYCIHPDGWPAGWIQDFHLGDAIRWKFDASGLDSTTQAEWKRYAESPEAKTAKAEEERQRQEEKCSSLVTARGVYNAASPIEEAPDHPYLLAKRVRPVGPLRVGDVSSKTPGRVIHGVLLIPCFDVLSGELVALHRVFTWRDKETGKFPKGWFPGTSGGVFPIAGDVQRGPVFVAEGIATALSMYDLWIEEGEPEAPGILAWAVRGYLEWQEGGLREPAEVLDVTQDYRHEQDVLGAFLDECCLIGAGYHDTSKNIYDVYTQWTRDNGIFTQSSTKLMRDLADRGFDEYRDMHARGRRGLCVKP